MKLKTVWKSVACTVREYRRIEFRFRDAYDRHLQHRPARDSTKLNINPSNCNLSIDSRPCFLVTLNAHIPWLIKRRGWRSIAYRGDRGDRGARTKLLAKHLAVSCMQITPYHDAKRLEQRRGSFPFPFPCPVSQARNAPFHHSLPLDPWANVAALRFLVRNSNRVHARIAFFSTSSSRFYFLPVPVAHFATRFDLLRNGNKEMNPPRCSTTIVLWYSSVYARIGCFKPKALFI